MVVRVDLCLWLMVYPRSHVAIEGATTYAETCSVGTPSCLDELVYNVVVIAQDPLAFPCSVFTWLDHPPSSLFLGSLQDLDLSFD